MDAFLRGDIVAFRIDRHARGLLEHLTGERIEPADLLDLFVKQLDAHGVADHQRQVARHRGGRRPRQLGRQVVGLDQQRRRQPQRRALELEVAIPRKRHENIRNQ